MKQLANPNPQTALFRAASSDASRAVKPGGSGKSRATATRNGDATERQGSGNGAGSSLPSGARQEVVFQFQHDSAKEVLLAGNFTNWDKAPIQMLKNADGAWFAKVLLAPGRYHYKYLVDGEWRDDPKAGARCPNPFGTSNNILEVS